MPQSGETQAPSTESEAFFQRLEDFVKVAIKLQGFTATLKLLNRGRLPTSGVMGTIHEGVFEQLPSGRYDAALQTDKGPLFLRNAEEAGRDTSDPQSVPSRSVPSLDATADSAEVAPDQLLRQLTDTGANPPCSLLCTIELTRFDPSQRQALLPLLWQYILDHRNSNDRDDLVAVGAAIRKYVAIMPMDRMGELAVVLETGHRSPLPIDLEIEVAKMIYRNFEVHPPVAADPHPELAQRLWEIVQAYINPRVLLRDKCPAVASLAIEAIVSMRSPLAEQAWQAAVACPYRWFAELVGDDLDELQERWSSENRDAAAWLCELRTHVLAHA